jgi:hypothetical protein
MSPGAHRRAALRLLACSRCLLTVGLPLRVLTILFLIAASAVPAPTRNWQSAGPTVRKRTTSSPPQKGTRHVCSIARRAAVA